MVAHLRTLLPLVEEISKQNEANNAKLCFAVYLERFISILRLIEYISMTYVDANKVSFENYNFLQHIQLILQEVQRYVSKLLLQVLNDLECALTQNNFVSGTFLNLMDLALNKVSKIEVKDGFETMLEHFEEASTAVEELLCIAMSVAHLGVDDDPKIIKGSCQAVSDLNKILI